ncbi:MAG: hypothetical protein RM368_15540 [Nostoc sp. DedSLP03]|uniref:hypothetical protein n=1 Tax=Nostoc sp. DedSLP03 TaxID=3075400 RepID=UPI002AD39F9B|nr:hypothetical protein [Nostoc sp. DedSLP03]MDZ7966366.1 hypothetical protein [Nostoc sp. DedSLP03]
MINRRNKTEKVLGFLPLFLQNWDAPDDVVIALNAPQNMQLEHTDNSFDYLCPSINQPHYKHPSENQIVTNI